jgi:ArsR family transcriptional regulator
MRNTLLVLKALADRNRLRIIKMLQRKPMCVCEITAVLGISQPSVSRHLRVLRDAGLVRDRRGGPWIDYEPAFDTDNPTAAELLALLGNLMEDDPQMRADREAAEKAIRTELLCSGEEKENR